MVVPSAPWLVGCPRLGFTPERQARFAKVGAPRTWASVPANSRTPCVKNVSPPVDWGSRVGGVLREINERSVGGDSEHILVRRADCARCTHRQVRGRPSNRLWRNGGDLPGARLGDLWVREVRRPQADP